jgi:hypothetical protein
VKQLATDWLVYSETGLPGWLILTGFALALWAAHIWLRAERRNHGNWASRALPWTLTASLLLAALVLCRPVVVRTTTWENTAEIVAISDPSLSMQLPLRSSGFTGQLDIAAVWDSGATTGRNQAARDLREKLAALRKRAAEIATNVEAMIEGADQGVPFGGAAIAQMDDYSALRTSARVDVAAAAAAVQVTQSSGIAPTQRAIRDECATALAAVEKALASLPESLSSGTAPTADQLRAVLLPLLSLQSAADASLRLLDRLQEDSDRAFCEANKARITPVLTAAATRTRADLAAHAASMLPPGTIAAPEIGDPEQTDLYEQVSSAVAARKGNVISHCVLFSDGAHNGAPTSAVASRLKKDGIKLVTVGTAVAGKDAEDIAVLDWQLPRVLRAEKPARLRAETKASSGTPFKITLSAGDQTLATAEATAGAEGVTAITLEFKAPAAGRRVLHLAVSGTVGPASLPAGAEAGTTAQIQVDCSERETRMLLVGTVPDWDTAWLSLAARRAGVTLTQVYTAGDAPKRGGLSRAIPSSLLQWSRYRAVILHGAAFSGLSEQDVTDLYRFVTEKGGNLLVFAGEAAGFDVALASRFGWVAPASVPEVVTPPSLRFSPASAGLPCVRLGTDGPQSARLFAALPPPGAAFMVPAQDLVLVETVHGQPVCSLGFYGRGKVLHWGMRGLHRMREFDNAQVVDRLLDDIVGEIAAPLLADESKDPCAIYPPLPESGHAVLTIVPFTPEKPAPARIKFGGQDIAPLRVDHASALFRITPKAPAAEIDVAGQRLRVPVANNRGLEILCSDFNEDFLRSFATAAGGEYVHALKARQTLESLTAQTYVTQTSRTWHPGSSTVLLAGLIVVAALHWVLRKLAGLAI